jgi:hypothetical protein
LEAVLQEKEVILDSGDCDESDEENITAVEEMIVEAEEVKESDGKDIHDDTVVRTLRDQAIQMAASLDITIDEKEQEMSLQLFPRVSINPFIYLF